MPNLAQLPFHLLPASASRPELFIQSNVATDSIIAWSFGRGSVIWRIWPAVLLHIAFAAAVVSMSLETQIRLALPPVLLTVLGVVIGFVISYRAMTGYDRYWMGRSCWGDVIRNARAMGRLIWYHVPPQLTVERLGGKEEMMLVMREKRMALDLVEAFAVALKHHLRGELGIYYEDLYHLVEPLHDHRQHIHLKPSFNSPQTIKIRHSKKHHHVPTVEVDEPREISRSPSSHTAALDPEINEYGTFDPASTSSLSVNSIQKGKRMPQRSSTQASVEYHCDDEHEHLLGHSELAHKKTGKIAGDLVPFMSIFSRVIFWSKKAKEDVESGLATDETEIVISDSVPMDVLKVLSEWLSVLEARGTVPGGSVGSMAGCISSFEESLSSLEKILTTPLPFVYSTHIRHTVWIYLFFLPFQLVGEFGWSTIPGVGIAAFIYLGFLAAGEEIEQPFGYDSNDLDLDLFTGKIIHGDLADLKKSPCLNAYHSHPSERKVKSITEAAREIGRNHDVVEWDGDRKAQGNGYGVVTDVYRD